MLQKLAQSSPKIVGYQLSQTVTQADCQAWLPQLEAILQQDGELGLLLLMTDFQGLTLWAIWEILKFKLQRGYSVTKLAIIGKPFEWQRFVWWIKPFYADQVRYFDRDDLAEAWRWLQFGQPRAAETRAQAQAIIEAHGQSALARLALFNDKAYYFSPGGSVIAYRVKGPVALALGDPIGPLADVLPTINGFKAYCAQYDCLASFINVSADYLPYYHQANYQQICVGYEGIVDVATFTISGRKNKNFRAEFNRLTKLGYQAKVHSPPHPTDLISELKQVSDAWLTMMHGQEKHFFMGWFDDEYINSTYVITIYNKTGQIVAFANFMQEYQVNDIGIDLMRRLPTTEDGTMDFLFISLIQWVKEQGYGGLNLSLSPLAKVGNYPSDPLIERAIHAIYEHVNLFYNFKGLYTFKQKFHPHWKPRYLVYAHLNDLPLIAIALFRLSTSDQFVLDYFRELLTGLPEPNPIKLRLFSR